MFTKKTSSVVRRRNGFVSIYMVFTSLFLIAMVGLAIDFSVLYNVKAKLQAAVDAAAIGSGAMLQSSTNLDDPNQVSALKDAAQRFFNANYPAGYWATTPAYYSATPSEDSTTHVRTMYVHAAEYVPMLFLRVVGITRSEVAAQASTKVRFVTMMIVVDRSGSVTRAGNDGVIKSALNNFVTNTPTSTPAGQSVFVDGRDVIGMGSFGTNWNLDFAPSSSFRSGTPDIGTAISNIPFGNNATNTAEGLYRGYKQLQALNNTGALNVIVLLTDGRPSALTVTMNIQSTCIVPGNKTGVITANVGQTWPPLPPQSQGGTQDAGSQIWAFGLYNPVYSGLGSLLNGSDLAWAVNSLGCHYSSDGGQPIPGTSLSSDIATFPATDAYNNSTTGPVYQGEGQSTADPRAVRYASFNAADNMATTIRQDTTLRPVLFVIGLNEPPAGGEPLDADWLARVANDPSYKDVNGNSVYQSGQTSGLYYNVTASGLGAAFQDISSQILRLAQ